MDDYVDAIIRVKVPKWQIGEEVSVYFPDTMMKRGKCEALDEGIIQEVLNKRCMTAVTNEYLVSLHGKRPQGEWIEKQETPASVSYYCSNCKMRDLPFLPYCPWCGAKMKGGAK